MDVSENIDLPAGGNPTAAVVEIYLAGEGGLPVSGYHTPSGRILNGSLRPTIATDGSYTVDLEPNSEIQPVGTKWRRNLIYRGRITGGVTYWDVPAFGGPYQAQNIVSTIPTTVDAMQQTSGPLGVVTDIGAGSAPTGGTWDAYTDARRYSVVISGLDTVNVTCARKAAVGTHVGTVILIGGTDNTDWWSTSGQSPEDWIDDELVADGYQVIQTKFDAGDGWWVAPTGVREGSALQANRIASLVYKLWELYEADGTNNLLLSGHSGGADGCAKVIARYGLASILKGLFPSAGPPFAALRKSCTLVAGYGDSDLRTKVAATYGEATAAAACDPAVVGAFGDLWDDDSSDVGAFDRQHPSTLRIYNIIGETDTQQLLVSSDWVADLRAAGQKVTRIIVENMGHGNQPDGPGRIVLAAAIKDEKGIIQHPVRLDTASASSVNHLFEFAINPGKLLVAVVRAATLVANVTVTGWTAVGSVDIDASTSISVWSRTAVTGDTGVTVGFGSAVASTIDIYEADVDAPTLHKSGTINSGSAVTTLTVTASAAQTAAKTFGLCAIGVPSTATWLNTWTNSWVRQTQFNAKLAVATKSPEVVGTPSTNETWTGAVRAGGVIAVWAPG